MKRRNFFRTLSGGLLGLVGGAVTMAEWRRAVNSSQEKHNKFESYHPHDMDELKKLQDAVNLYQHNIIDREYLLGPPMPKHILRLHKKAEREMAKVIFDDMLKL